MTEKQCPNCMGSQTIGDSICSECGGTGYILATDARSELQELMEELDDLASYAIIHYRASGNDEYLVVKASEVDRWFAVLERIALLVQKLEHELEQYEKHKGIVYIFPQWLRKYIGEANNE